MKRQYEQPETKVIKLNNQSHLCVVSQIGEGGGDFDVKPFSTIDDSSVKLKNRDLWEDEW